MSDYESFQLIADSIDSLVNKDAWESRIAIYESESGAYFQVWVTPTPRTVSFFMPRYFAVKAYGLEHEDRRYSSAVNPQLKFYAAQDDEDLTEWISEELAAFRDKHPKSK